ncbi:MAG TPA: CAP domain-containing protein [Pyrinomonadaceae bacterium]|nr:CAP domain-containing protein [Pyrinomonadaceae bacterium]
MARHFLLAIVLSTVVLGLFAAAAAQSNEESDIFELVNRERTRSRLGYLEWDDDLARVARNFSRQMALENFFGHSDRDGKTVIQRAAKVGWSKIGENLFMCDGMNDFTSFSVRGWMRSPTHRQNILDREWTDTGIGIYRTRDNRVYVTQVFVRR